MDWAVVEIGEEHVEALRAYLAGDTEAWHAIQSEMTTDETAAGYMSLIYAAFATAVRRKFSPTYTTPDIVRWVADLRIALGEDGEQLNARVVENLIQDVLGDPASREHEGLNDPYAVVPAECATLSVLVGEAEFDGAGLEEFIADAAEFARDWVATRQRESSAV